MQIFAVCFHLFGSQRQWHHMDCSFATVHSSASPSNPAPAPALPLTSSDSSSSLSASSSASSSASVSSASSPPGSLAELPSVAELISSWSDLASCRPLLDIWPQPAAHHQQQSMPSRRQTDGKAPDLVSIELVLWDGSVPTEPIRFAPCVHCLCSFSLKIPSSCQL